METTAKTTQTTNKKYSFKYSKTIYYSKKRERGKALVPVPLPWTFSFGPFSSPIDTILLPFFFLYFNKITLQGNV
jgi:uncharacterized protein YceK